MSSLKEAEELILNVIQGKEKDLGKAFEKEEELRQQSSKAKLEIMEKVYATSWNQITLSHNKQKIT